MLFAFMIMWNAENSSVREREKGSGRNVDVKQFGQTFRCGSVNDVKTQIRRFVFHALFSGKQ